MEHISKQGTVKEGYLTEESAREAALVMKYKYDETFAVYKCSKCGLFHIGRQGGLKMNDGQSILENREEMEGRLHYRLICSNTGIGFLNLLNQEYEEGFRVFGDIEKTEQTDAETGVRYIKRSAYLYNTEDVGLNSDEKTKRMEIINTIDNAEDYLYRKKSLLEDRENYLILNTPWDAINNARNSKGLPKISNEKQRNGYLNQDKQLETLRVEVHEAEQYLKLVKKYAELHELPQRESPWERKAREAEEKAQAEDEQSSEVYVEKIGAEEVE